jgi:hypothetical protein
MNLIDFNFDLLIQFEFLTEYFTKLAVCLGLNQVLGFDFTMQFLKRSEFNLKCGQLIAI